MPLLLAILLTAGAVPSEPQWRYDGATDGMRVELRAVPGSPFDEIRVTAISSASLQALCDAIFAKGLSGKAEGRFKRRDVIKETDTDRWTYEQISVPVVSDRDYVMHVKLEQPASSGTCRVSFQTETEASHPPVQGFVRIPSIRGSWTLVPADGTVRVSYEVFSDPGGGVPAFLVRGKQRDAAVDFFKVILARATAKVASP